MSIIRKSAAPTVAPSSGIGAWVRERPLLAFFALAFGFTWPFMIVDALASWGLLPVRMPLAGPGVILTLLASYGPTLAALVVTGMVAGKAGIRRLLGRLFIWRVGVGWYVAAIFLPAFQFLIAVQVYSLLSGVPPTFPPLSFGLVAGLALQFVVRGLLNGEEIGWRGFALPGLQARQNALTASLTLGVIWAVFHLPNFFTLGGGAFGGQASVPPLGFLLSLLASSVVSTWVFNNTRGSLLLAYLMHAATNTWAPFFPGIDPASASTTTVYWLSVGVGLLTAGIVVAVFGPAHLSRKPVSELPTPPYVDPTSAET